MRFLARLIQRYRYHSHGPRPMFLAPRRAKFFQRDKRGDE